MSSDVTRNDLRQIANLLAQIYLLHQKDTEVLKEILKEIKEKK